MDLQQELSQHCLSHQHISKQKGCYGITVMSIQYAFQISLGALLQSELYITILEKLLKVK